MSGFKNDVMVAKNADFSQTGAPNAASGESNGLITNGKLWIGSTAANVGGTHINVGSLTSPDSSVTIGYSSPNITLIANGSMTTQTLTGDVGGPISPTAGNFNIFGTTTAAATTPLQTSGSGSTLTIIAQRSQAVAASSATRNGLAHFDSAAFAVDANGFVTLAGGGLAIDSIAVQTGTSPVVPTGAGLVTINGAVVVAGTNPIRSNGTGANTLALEVQTSQALAAADATKIGLSNFSSADFAVAATGFVTLATAGAGKTITGDSGGALSPSSNNWNILGGPGVTTSGSGSTLTINSVVFTDTAATTMAVDNGYFATAAGTYNLPASAAQGEMIIIVADTAGAVVVDAPALNFIRVGTLLSAASGTATSTATGDSLTLRYRLSSLTWEAVSVVGTWVVA